MFGRAVLGLIGDARGIVPRRVDPLLTATSVRLGAAWLAHLLRQDSRASVISGLPGLSESAHAVSNSPKYF
jgi:hypothetical protein